jgi:serine/threonine protein kinase
MRQPECVSEVIAGGSGGFIGLVRSKPGCVLKFCSPLNVDAVECLQRETEVLQVLGTHEYIVELESVGPEGLYLTYYPFGSIRDYYGTRNRLQGNESLENCESLLLPPLEDRLRWCHQCVAGLAYIHSKGILHNDISTRNILLSADLTIKICDFGFSTSANSTSPVAGPATIEVLGRAETRYERSSATRFTEAVVQDDLFALGSLFFEILSGKRPYEEVNSCTVERRYQEGEFACLDGIQEREWARIIDKCWKEEYACIDEVQDELPPRVERRKDMMGWLDVPRLAGRAF